MADKAHLKRRQGFLGQCAYAIARGEDLPSIPSREGWELLRKEVDQYRNLWTWVQKQPEFGYKLEKARAKLEKANKTKKKVRAPLKKLEARSKVSDAVRALYDPAEATEEVVTQEALTKDDILKKAEAASNEAWDYKKTDWSST